MLFGLSEGNNFYVTLMFGQDFFYKNEERHRACQIWMKISDNKLVCNMRNRYDASCQTLP